MIESEVVELAVVLRHPAHAAAGRHRLKKASLACAGRSTNERRYQCFAAESGARNLGLQPRVDKCMPVS